MIKKFFLRFYNQGVEDICTRILYFFNTLDTYFIVAGALSFLIYGIVNYSVTFFLITTIVVLLLFKIADFYPLFLAFSPAFLFLLFRSPFLSLFEAGFILMINIGIFVVVQFLFMGIPDSIVARDATVGIRKIWNSIFTIAPTTVSFLISVYFSTLYALILVARPSPLNSYGLAFWVTICIASLTISRVFDLIEAK